MRFLCQLVYYDTVPRGSSQTIEKILTGGTVLRVPKLAANQGTAQRLGWNFKGCADGKEKRVVHVSSCVICDGEIHTVRRALVAPFLAKRIWGRKPFCVDLVFCGACGFTFYNPRLEAEEEMRLYAGYHSQEYQKERQASEPWYTPKFNADFALESAYDRRRRSLASVLRKYTEDRKIERVLDYGGERGQVVCGLIEGADAFVYDVCGIPPVPGVTSIREPRKCNADLIINTNVLEHVGFPRSMVKQVFDSAPSRSLVFLEVPSESPNKPGRILRRFAQVGVMSVFHPSLAASVIRPAALYMMHEHINYFTERSLLTLMRACGGLVVASGIYRYVDRYAKTDMLWCLGTVP